VPPDQIGQSSMRKHRSSDRSKGVSPIPARTLGLAVLVAIVAGCAASSPPRPTGVDPRMQSSRIDYGRITAVERVTVRNQDAQVAGALVGGLLGVASGSGQSTSNRALRGIAGATAGGLVGDAAGSSMAFEYTVLLGGTNTIRLVTEKPGLRIGDCVSLERGRFNNIRLAEDARCEIAAAEVPRADLAEADACAVATQQVLDATTDEDFERAERRMRILCD
jgi:outer membrane lipoprotein SlyB